MSKLQWLPGETYICTHSASPGYKYGEKYTAYTNDKGYTCLRGSDGYEDICTMLVSAFRVAPLKPSYTPATTHPLR